MTYDPEWFLKEDTDDAREHRAFLGVDKKGQPLAVPTPPVPRRKRSTPANYITKAALERRLDAVCEDLGKWIGREVIKPFDARMKLLEESPCEFRGPWREAEAPYEYRSLVVRSGCCWFARVKTDAKPGANRDWVLVAKGKKEMADA
jgi:hypothetical protein